ncbi:MAG: OmpA family protein [Deltaproteobacteria bacterium]|nr:OmpA family protein [Deltaproteobacteria bacterium]
MKNRKKIIVSVMLIVFGTSLVGCAQWQASSRTTKGSLIGAAAGAAAGILAKQNDPSQRAKAALLGAAIGATTGGLVGNYMDKQARELQSIRDAQVRQEQDKVFLTFDSGILFDVNSTQVKPGAMQNMAKVANVMNRYPQTNITVSGYTDSTGSEQYNQKLSEARARAVANYLQSRGVSSYRIHTIGYGESMPVAGNSTAAGRQANRRVEIEIKANQALYQQQQQTPASGYPPRGGGYPAY